MYSPYVTTTSYVRLGCRNVSMPKSPTSLVQEHFLYLLQSPEHEYKTAPSSGTLTLLLCAAVRTTGSRGTYATPISLSVKALPKSVEDA